MNFTHNLGFGSVAYLAHLVYILIIMAICDHVKVWSLESRVLTDRLSDNQYSAQVVS